MSGIFDFAPNSHVAVEVPPDEPNVVSFNGWDFTAKPNTPYRRKFTLTISGMHWRLNEAKTQLDMDIDPLHNAGRLLEFYQKNRRWDTFQYPHEYLGLILCRFAEPLSIPAALPNSSGLIADFQTTLVHHNPGF